MAYTQIRDANWRVPYVGGWCLKYVQDAFGTDHPYASAIDAWNANYGGGNHPGETPPAGKTVAIYFSLGSVPAGHVAISLDDGSVASSTQSGTHAEGFIHPNLQNLIDVYAEYNGGCSVLGWTEYVGTVQVVQQEQSATQQLQGGEMAEKTNLDTARIITHGVLARNGLSGRQNSLDGSDDAELNANHVGIDLTNAYVQSLFLSDEGRQWRDSQDVNSIQGINSRLNGIPVVQNALDSEKQRTTDLTASLADATKQISTLKAQADKPPAEAPPIIIAPIQKPTPPTPSQSTSTRPQTFIEWLVSLFKVPK